MTININNYSNSISADSSSKIKSTSTFRLPSLDLYGEIRTYSPDGKLVLTAQTVDYLKLSTTLTSSMTPTLRVLTSGRIVAHTSTQLSYSTNAGSTWTAATINTSTIGSPSFSTIVYGNSTYYAISSTETTVFALRGGANGTTFDFKNMFPTTSNWWGATAANGNFLIGAGAWNAASSIALKSTDSGNTFTSFASPTTGSMSGLVYAGDTYCWAASLIGAQGSSNAVYTSTDFNTWTLRTLGASFFGVSIASDGTSNVIASGTSSSGNGTFNYIYSSSDKGVTWTQRTLPSTSGWGCCGYGNGVFVALPTGTGGGQTISTTAAAYSTDNGVTWSAMTMPAAGNNWTWALWNPTAAKWLAIRYSGNAAATSTNGSTWTAATLPANVGWSGALVAGGTWYLFASGSNTYYTSTDATNWTTRTHPISTGVLGAAYTGTTFIAPVASGSRHYISSTDGINWETSWTNLTSVAAFEFIGTRFVALSGASTNLSYGSTTINGAYSTGTLPSTTTWSYLTKAGTYLFATNIRTAQNTIARTSDGSTWTSITLPSSQKWGKMVYNGSNLYLITINDSSAATTTYATSATSDSGSWTSRTLPVSKVWCDPVYDGTNFGLASRDGTTILKSSNGIDWTSSSSTIGEFLGSSIEASSGDTYFSADNATVFKALNTPVRGSTSVASPRVQLGSYSDADGIDKFSYAPNRFSTNGDAQTSIMVLIASTTDATQTTMTTDGTAASATDQFVLKNNSVALVKGTVISRSSGGDTKTWNVEAMIKRGADAASTALVGTPTITAVANDTNAAAWAVAITADTTNGALAVKVTGAAATSIRWVSTLNITEGIF